MAIKNISKSIWLSLIPFILLSILAIVLLLDGTISPYYLIATVVMWTLISGLGIAVGYHRVFSHKTHSLPTWKENIILFFAALAGQGSSIFWVAVHRGYHHPNSDTEKDLHSPITKSLWVSFFGWTTNERIAPVSMKYSIDLIRKPNHTWFNNHVFKILWGVPIIVAMFDWKLSLVGCCLSTGIGLLQDNLVNIFGHLKALIGYRNFNTKDNSHNNFILGYLGWGQGWHNNHHHSPASYDFGRSVSGKWWEFDFCRAWLWFLGKPNKSAGL